MEISEFIASLVYVVNSRIAQGCVERPCPDPPLQFLKQIIYFQHKMSLHIHDLSKWAERRHSGKILNQSKTEPLQDKLQLLSLRVWYQKAQTVPAFWL